MSETRRRFLRAIAEQVGAEQVVEVHLFQPMRHGGRETGVAVVAVDPSSSGDGENLSHIDNNSATDADAAGSDDPGIPAGAPESPTAHAAPSRLTVYRAQYRHTLKGPDRGRWELELVAEADAPLLAVDDVVRGVHRRAGEEVEPERLTGDGFRAALVEERWSASAR